MEIESIDKTGNKIYFNPCSHYELNLNIISLGKFPVEVNMTDIPEGVLRGTDRSSNFVSTGESPPPIPPRSRNENSDSVMAEFKYATHA
jgi:hypothetical protein